MRRALALVLLCCMMVAGASALTLTASVTEHSIVWQWDAGTVYMVYVDGLHTMNTTLGRYHLSDLRPYEEHRLDLYLYDPAMHAVNATADLNSPDWIATREGTSIATTLHSTTMLYFGIGMISILVLLSYLGRSTVYGVIMAIMALVGSVMLIYIVMAYSIFFVMVVSMLLILSLSVLVFDLYRLLLASDAGWYFV